MTDNTQARDAKRIIHGLHHMLRHIQAGDLHGVAKAMAVRFNLPNKAMIKAMAHYARVHHTH